MITYNSVFIFFDKHRIRRTHRTLHPKIKETGYGEKSSQ